MAAPDSSLLATKRIVYVGGLGNDVKEDLIRAAFIPFGNIKSVMMVSVVTFLVSNDVNYKCFVNSMGIFVDSLLLHTAHGLRGWCPSGICLL